ncbi:visual pigment-like receptor peropsin isoform X3 [Centruroides sculpturatus]|uniref:visual pigment-like receptor peropsin isoform X3 n=1 Tax=Centruroides sculpturatus TaxID=218467 RepID=UPI000C6EF9E6|nr:visual pigment-like receptor peropsin isoform X3 [Centruroides sculpturatus]
MNDIDVISDYPNEDQKDVMESNPFLPCTHYIIGVYLLVIGILGTFGNGIIIATFFRFRILLSPTTTLLINLAIADLGICLFGFPFSSSSSFANKWLYGDGGCQWYAFMGFLFGSAHIATLVALGLDRYFVLCNLNTRRRLIFRRYYLMIIVIWIYALFWSVMPLLGWGRYNLEPSLTTCTIDWRHNDTSYKSFLSTYFIFGYVIPCIIIATSYFIATKRIKSDKITITDISIPIRDRWDNERHMTLTIVFIIIGFLLAWTPYAILCMWTVFADPSTVPSFLTLLPPLFAKASTVFNPFIYFFTNPHIRIGMKATLQCCKNVPDEMFELSNSPECIRVTQEE